MIKLATPISHLFENEEYEEARKVYERCLAGREKVLGEDHKKTLMTVNNLGNVYYGLQDYEKALEYYERALKGYEKTLGKTHPDTLTTVMNIANVYICYCFLLLVLQLHYLEFQQWLKQQVG